MRKMNPKPYRDLTLFLRQKREKRRDEKAEKNLQRFSGVLPFSGSSSILHRRNCLSLSLSLSNTHTHTHNTRATRVVGRSFFQSHHLQRQSVKRSVLNLILIESFQSSLFYLHVSIPKRTLDRDERVREMHGPADLSQRATEK